jgi:TonB-linked SusC/RagA family outer membrane protein
MRKPILPKKILFAFLLFSIGWEVSAQSRTVTGYVASMDDRTAMPGVNIIVKGTTTGTSTDGDGKFSIEVNRPEEILVISFIGYLSEEIMVGNRTDITVYLSPSLEQLAEIVVVGYSEKKREEITGAVSNLSSEALKGVTGSNLEYMLQGKVAGVQVSTATGAPGAAAEIRIRGTSSISADRGPLVVVDGIIGGSYNPNDVESISVLKDAAAIALYGSRANPGVIIVTTKRGTSERPEITYRTTLGSREITTCNFQMMNSAELYETERAMFASSASFLSQRPAALLNTDTDWLGLAYKKGVIQNHNLSVRGKSGKVGYFLATDYYDEEGTLLTSGYKRLNFRSNLDFELSKDIKLSTNFNITRDNTDSYHWRWPYQPFLYLPYDTPYDAEGNIRYVDANTPGFLTRDKNNILHSALFNDYKIKGLNLNGDIVLSANLTSWLTLQSRNRLGYSSYRSDTYEDIQTIEGVGNGGVASFSVSGSYSLISTNLLRANWDFGAHQVGGMLAVEGSQYEYEDAGANGYGIISGIKVPGGIASPQAISGTKTRTAAMSFLSEVNYNYNQKYFASASFRRDGSSLFAPNKRWGNFGALSASWLINKEEFFASLRNTISILKLRTSYGLVGNDALDPFQYLATYAFTTQYNGTPAGFPNTISNDDLGWEQTKSANVGLEATLFNRVDVSIDAFNKNTDNLLFEVSLTPSQGIDQVWRNVGRLVTKGFEFDISSDVIRKTDFTWNVGVNFSTAQNRIKALTENGEQKTRDYDGDKQVIRVGEDANSFYLPKWAGVNPANGDPQWEKAIVDANGNIAGYELTSNYDEATQQIVGSATPKFYGGLVTSVNYKNFSLNVSSSYQYGNEVYHRTREFIDADGALFNFNMMQLADGWSRWEQPGDIATHPKPVFGGNKFSNKPSSRYLEDGSYWRIRNITLSYNIPVAVLTKVKITKANIFISGDNLFTFTKFSGLDPEVSLATNENQGTLSGLADFKYPISKQYLIGIQVSF